MVGRRETINFSKYNCVRTYKNGKNSGAFCKGCREVFTFKEEARLKNHFKCCPGFLDEDDIGDEPVSIALESSEENDENSQHHNTPTSTCSSTPTTTCQSTPRFGISRSGRKKRRCSPKSPPTAKLTSFFDSCTENQANEIKQKMLSFFIANEIKFEYADHPSFLELVATIRPQFSKTFKGREDLKATIPVLYELIMNKSMENTDTACIVKLTFAPELKSCLIMSGRNTFINTTDCFDITFDSIQEAVSIYYYLLISDFVQKNFSN